MGSRGSIFYSFSQCRRPCKVLETLRNDPPGPFFWNLIRRRSNLDISTVSTTIFTIAKGVPAKASDAVGDHRRKPLIRSPPPQAASTYTKDISSHIISGETPSCYPLGTNGSSKMRAHLVPTSTRFLSSSFLQHKEGEDAKAKPFFPVLGHWMIGDDTRINRMGTITISKGARRTGELPSQP